MLAVSGRGAGLLGARGGWAESERTGGEKGDGPRAWAAGESAGPAQGKGEGRGVWAWVWFGPGSWVELGFGFLFYFFFFSISISNSNQIQLIEFKLI